jgi:hypothetical protein
MSAEQNFEVRLEKLREEAKHGAPVKGRGLLNSIVDSSGATVPGVTPALRRGSR